VHGDDVAPGADDQLDLPARADETGEAGDGSVGGSLGEDDEAPVPSPA
jgi:hypothetical protein